MILYAGEFSVCTVKNVHAPGNIRRHVVVVVDIGIEIIQIELGSKRKEIVNAQKDKTKKMNDKVWNIRPLIVQSDTPMCAC